MSNINLQETQKLYGTIQDLTAILQYCSSAHLHVTGSKETDAIAYQLERISHLMNIIKCEIEALKRVLNHEKEPKLDKNRRNKHVETTSENH